AVAADRDRTSAIRHRTAFGTGRGGLAEGDRAFGGRRGSCTVSGGEAAGAFGQGVRADGNGLGAQRLRVRRQRVGAEIPDAECRAALEQRVMELIAGDGVRTARRDVPVGKAGEQVAVEIDAIPVKGHATNRQAGNLDGVGQAEGQVGTGLRDYDVCVAAEIHRAAGGYV